MKDKDYSPMDTAVSDLETALSSGDDSRIRSAYEHLESLLNAAGSRVPSENATDDGAYDV